MNDKPAELFGKLINRFCEMYLNADKDVFMTSYSKFEKQIKLNTKIRSLVEESDIIFVYAAISFFDKMAKKQSFNEAYEIASKHYKIPEKVLRSAIGTRNANRRNALKW